MVRAFFWALLGIAVAMTIDPAEPGTTDWTMKQARAASGSIGPSATDSSIDPAKWVVKAAEQHIPARTPSPQALEKRLAAAADRSSDSDGGLSWTVQREFNPMDDKEYVKAVASHRAQGGGTIDIEAICDQSTVTLSFFSFDSHDNPLSYEISPGSGHRDYVSVRIRYDLDEPVPFTLSLKHYDNEVSLNLTGKALSDFTEANVIRLELPLSDRRRAFPEIRPQNKVFKDIIAPCISTIRREQQRAVSQALERERKHQAYLTKLKAQYEMQCERWGNWYRNCYQRPNCSVPFAAKPNSSSEYSCEAHELGPYNSDPRDPNE
jgi:hypothetical protein